MKINIIHHNNSSDVLLDAQTLDYVLKRCKEKTGTPFISIFPILLISTRDISFGNLLSAPFTLWVSQ